MQICPACGAEMVIRTAKKGKYKGQKFYGCSTYPKCKEIVNIGNDEKNKKSSYKVSNQKLFTNEVSARHINPGIQRKYFDSLPVTEQSLDTLSYDKEKIKQFESISKWYIEYSQKIVGGKQDYNEVISILIKILTRGNITILSKYAEKEVLKLSNSLTNSSLAKFIDYDYEYAMSLDSTEEEIFYHEILPEILGDNYREYVFPQMQISALIADDNISDFKHQYVDFFVSDGTKGMVVEIDGLDHESKKKTDKKRDDVLIENNIPVLRLSTKEIRENSQEMINKMKERIKDFNFELELLDIDSESINYLRVINQVNLSIAYSLKKGMIDLNSKIQIDLDKVFIEKKRDLVNIIEKDINQLLNNILSLYYTDKYQSNLEIQLFDNLEENSNLIITYDQSLVAKSNKLLIRQFKYPYEIAYYNFFSNSVVPENINEQTLEYFLEYIFRKQTFWEGQYEIIKRTLLKKDSIVLLPTGAGKSISYQLSSLLSTGVSIIVAPIIALIDDQVDNLRSIGISKAIGISSQIKDDNLKRKYVDLFAKGHYSMCMISPERFQIKAFRDSIRELLVSNLIASIVIDEAHCVSEWGHDFRTSYLNIGRVTRNLCSRKNYVPPLLGLTGTASSSVLKDVKRILEIEDFDAIISPDDFNREELNFDILKSKSKNKKSILNGILTKRLPYDFNVERNNFFENNKDYTNSGLVFCPHVNGNYGVVEVSDYISKDIGIKNDYYSGSKPKTYSNPYAWDINKKRISRNFKINEFPLLVATKSYGMGIDKSNIRYTIHYGLPQSIESFYQEAGRAGRDKRKAQSYVIMSVDDEKRADKLLDVNTSIEEVSRIMEEEVNWGNADDITRQMYFHKKSFNGVKKEMEIRDLVFKQIEKFENNVTKEIVTKNEDDFRNFEKIIHRLVVLGIVDDYTVQHASKSYKVHFGELSKDRILEYYSKYIEGYSKKRLPSEIGKIDEIYDLEFYDFAKKSVRILTEFVYETIEKSRRRGFYEIYSISKDALSSNDSDSIIRKRMLAYLKLSNSEDMDQILEAEDLGFLLIQQMIDGYELDSGKIISGIVSPKDANQLRGNVIRALESYPDHPGLLFLRGVIEVYCENANYNDVISNIKAGINFSKSVYQSEGIIQEMQQFLIWMLNSFFEYDAEIYKKVFADIIHKAGKEEFIRLFFKSSLVKKEILNEPLSIYLDESVNKVNNILNNLY